jgi:hypothetical protein
MTFKDLNIIPAIIKYISGPALLQIFPLQRLLYKISYFVKMSDPLFW